MKGQPVRQLGDIHDRMDTKGAAPLRVVVVSGDHYSQVTGMVWVCPVHPVGPHTPDHPLFIRFNSLNAASYVLPDEVYRMPALGLGEPSLDHVVAEAMAKIQNILRGIFSR